MTIQVEIAWAHEALIRAFDPVVADGPPEFTIREDPDFGGLAQICRRGPAFRAVAGCRTEGQLITEFSRLVEEHLARRSPDPIVHSGLVGVGGSAVLVVGGSTAGKSTMVAQLVGRAHAGYFSDEMVALSADGSLDGFFRPIHLRHGGARIGLPGWESVPSSQFDVLVPPSRARVGKAGRSVVVRLDRQPGRGSVDMVPLSTAALVRLLVANSFNLLESGPDRLLPLIAFGQRALGVRLIYGESGDAVDPLGALAEGEIPVGRADTAGPLRVTGRRGRAWVFADSVLVEVGSPRRVVAIDGTDGVTKLSGGEGVELDPTLQRQIDDRLGGSEW